MSGLSKVRGLMRSAQLYVLMDWAASGLGFLTMLVLYRGSSSLLVLGNSAWLLNLLNVSLFTSMAAQYFCMFRKTPWLNAYLSFTPVLVLEFFGLLRFINGFMYLILVGIILLDVGFAAYRGSLMRDGRLAEAALWNFLAQMIRCASLVLFLWHHVVSVGVSLLLSTLSAYVVVCLGLLCQVVLKGSTLPLWTKENPVNELGSSFWYSLVCLGIYLLTSVDMLSLKAFPTLRGEFALMKPWGQILYVGSMPFVNVYLTRLEQGQSAKKMMSVLCLFWVTYGTATITGIRFVNHAMFRVTSQISFGVVYVLLEYVFMTMVVAVFYRFLKYREGASRILIATVVAVGTVVAVPHVFPERFVLAGFFAAFAGAWVISKHWGGSTVAATTGTP